jgi:hypothetical protein
MPSRADAARTRNAADLHERHNSGEAVQSLSEGNDSHVPVILHSILCTVCEVRGTVFCEAVAEMDVDLRGGIVGYPIG